MMGSRSIFLFVVAVFLAGTISGFFLGARFQQEKVKKAEQGEKATPGEPPVSREDHIMTWMVGYLELTDQQEKEIRPLLRLAIKEYDELELEHEWRIDAFIENSDRRIANHLSEEQAHKLFKYNRVKRERRDAQRAAKEARESRAAATH